MSNQQPTASSMSSYDLPEKNAANYVPLSPLSFLPRTAATYPDHPAVVHGARRYSWSEAYERCKRLGSALSRKGIGKGDTVAVMAPNTPEMWEAHYGVPMAGAVLNTLNVRLDAATLGFILNHGEAKVLLTDSEFHAVIAEALKLVDHDILVVDIEDSEGPGGERLGSVNYEDFLASGDPGFDWQMPGDEWDAIALNYTSGTTGNPKGVIYHHRGAYLNAVGNVMTWQLPHHPVYLWTLPMFHCNGWCFPWTITAQAGTHVCLRKVSTDDIYAALSDRGVTHLCGAPIIMQMVLDGSEAQKASFEHTVNMMTAAAPPPAKVLADMKANGFDVTHVYGLTETYGPSVVCAWNQDWNSLSIEDQAAKQARQGVAYAVQEELMVADPDSLQPVPADGQTIGEVMTRGNIVMKGYLKNPATTEESFKGGWYHTGDLGVMHPDGYIQLKDRSKDIIISGGENISSIEIEDLLYKHPAVLAAAVVAKPDEKWGETPCAFIELKSGHSPTAEEIIAFCRDNLAHFKCPRTVIFGDLPKTSTGKIQKFVLRQQV
ncbi:acyl-CoA synthetase [Rhodovibrionaceae bacterium A322]